MKTKTLFLFFICSTICAAQAQSFRGPKLNARYDAPFPSITNQYATPFLVANIPLTGTPQISVCNTPANVAANSGPCTNYATTYTSNGNTCPNGMQDTPQPQPSLCQSGGDAQGNIGFWAAPGMYDYTVCISNHCFGPYTVNLTVAPFNGTCTMAAGTCSLIPFSPPLINIPTCFVTWTGTGTLTGILSSQRSTSGIQPKSSVNSDTAVVDWGCTGDPN